MACTVPMWFCTARRFFSLLAGEFRGHVRRVAPQPFEQVVLARAGVEHVHHEVDVVEQHPGDLVGQSVFVLVRDIGSTRRLWVSVMSHRADLFPLFYSGMSGRSSLICAEVTGVPLFSQATRM